MKVLQRESLPAFVLYALFLALGTGLGLSQDALQWRAGSGFRFTPLRVSGGNRVGFERVTPAASGIQFSNHLSDQTLSRNRLLEMGSGVALGDVDGDGRVDIYFCRTEGGNVLYRNLGSWKFEDVTASAGVACPGQYSTGCVFVDLDGDGDLDLLVNSLGGGTRAFINDGQGHFGESNQSFLQKMFGATSMALADVDGDGDLDLYVCNYRTDTIVDHPPGVSVEQRQLPDGRLIVEPRNRFLTLTNRSGAIEMVEKGEPDFFYLNRGGGRFSLARWDSGVFRDEEDRPLKEAPTDWGLSVMFRDFNGDGLPDLYVCNDFIIWADRIWLNQGGKRFRAAPKDAFRSVSLSSMAVDVADVNRDGFFDLFVADMLSPRREFRAWQRPDTQRSAIRWPIEDPLFRPEVSRNTLHLARGDGTFAEVAQWAGVAATDWTWGSVFLDVDLDGWEDLLVCTGANHDVQDADALPEISRVVGWQTPEARRKAFAMLPRRALPSMAFRNRHNGAFDDVGVAWGFDEVGVAHGMALGDLDNDGDLDVVINCLNGPARVLRNVGSAPRIAVRLKGMAQNTRGIGARIEVRGGPVTQSQEMIAGGRFLSSDDPMRTFAAGAASQLEIEVRWRSGKRSVVKGALPNTLYEIDESGAVAGDGPGSPIADPLFEDVSARLNHHHQDVRYDDFARQPLLPRTLSSLGPGVCWADLNGDGWDDLIVGGGRQGRLSAFLNNGKGGFAPFDLAGMPSRNIRGQTGVVVSRESGGALRVLVGQSNWEDADPRAAPVEVYGMGGGGLTNILRGWGENRSVSGPLALADVDGDGDLDLFVGGRAVPGRYPEPATSLLLRNQGDHYDVLQRFTELGLVVGAVFVDFDADGDSDLAVACEWGPIRLFRNDRGVFTEATEAMRLSSLKGWWNGIAVGDFDGDGRLDLVASNWGRNWRNDQPAGADRPVALYYGEFALDGIVQTLLASEDPHLAAMTPWAERGRVAGAMPAVGASLASYHAYGRASVKEVLGPGYESARRLEAGTFDSTVFLNRGDHFEARPLPAEAQYSPAFGVSVADFDGDGNEDLFLAQNFFGVDEETSRHDAGMGLVLVGNGRGGFRPLTPDASGVRISGEQRASAVADFDGDGRMDLVVTQHGGLTRLFRNRSGREGVRIRIRGTAGNPDAVGAVVRVRHGDRFSRAIELHAGGGYLSEDTLESVVAGSASPTGIQVRWPGGRVQEWPWPDGAKRVDVSSAGVRPR